MKVFVTGATGCLGAHIARELLEAGHEVRLLVRNPKMAQQYFAELGYTINDLVVADMTDTETVRSGMNGCDAVVHAAAVIDLDARNAEKTINTNLKGFDSVVGTACELGIPKILYVSSMSVFFSPGARVISETSPLGTANDAYTRSKRLCEEKARELQHQGKPIIITYPSSIFGPDDPKLSESNSALLKFVNLMVPKTLSGIQVVDVRDLAHFQRLLLEKPLHEPEKERYMLGGHFLPWGDVAGILHKATGLSIQSVYVPAWLFLILGRVFDFLRHFFTIEFPLSVESTRIVTSMPVSDSSHLQQVLGVQFRDVEETFRDTIAWLRKKNYLDK